MKYLIIILGIIFSFDMLYSQDDAFEIAQNTIKARGGNKLLSGISSVKMNVIINQKGKDQKATIYILNDQAYRIEFKDNPESNEYILVTKTNGIKSKKVNRIDSVSILTNQEVLSYAQKMDILGPLMNPREKNINLMFFQYEPCGNMKCKVIEYHNEANHSPEPTKLYISENNQLLRIEEKEDTDNGPKVFITEYSDYKPAKNSAAIFPYKITKDGTTMSIQELIINPDIAEVKMTLNDQELMEYARKK